MSTVASTKALDRWISVMEACEILQLSRRRVRELIADGRLKAVQISPRLWLVDSDDAHREANTERPPGRPPRSS